MDRDFYSAMIKALLITTIIVVLIVTSFHLMATPREAIQPETVTLEGHDYFKLPGYGWNCTLTHKGNCRACGGMEAEKK